MRTGRVGHDGLQNLKIGDSIEYSAGSEGHYINAMVTVTKKPGSTGVRVHVDTIISKGDLSITNEGEEILAGENELFW
jgi:hypothetical protein